MPEGHTIHRAARDHTKALAGDRVEVSSPQGRFREGAALVDGTRLDTVEAWGKHLFYRFEQDRTVHVHLGLYGKFWVHDQPPAQTHRQVRMRMAGKAVCYDLTGPIACEVLDPDQVAGVISRLGPDPLRADAEGGDAWPKLARRRGPIGVAIMDQTVVAGVGNVYRAESLYVHGLHPERPARSLEREDWDGLWETLRSMLRAGVRSKRIVTVDRHDDTVRDRRSRYVYKQETCGRCGSGIRRWDLAGRWAYACETCQPPWRG